MAWCASTGGISGEMIRDLMLQSVERRFGSCRLPHPVQWLSDNGSCYRAHETINFAIGLGLVPCFTPVRSLQSIGMAEAFVKTFKRDYVYVHDRPDAQSVLSQLSASYPNVTGSLSAGGARPLIWKMLLARTGVWMRDSGHPKRRP